MDHLYPLIKKLPALFIAVTCTLSATAQSVEYAALTKKNNAETYSAETKLVAEKIIRVKARNQNRIMLAWQPFTGDVSHYVLERSTNGNVFYEAGLLFTGSRDEAEPEYYFTDNLRVNYGGALYYRLRVVGMDGSEIVTPATRIGAMGGANLLTR